MILALYLKFPFILDKNLAKANCTENRVCTFCDTVVLAFHVNSILFFNIHQLALSKHFNDFRQIFIL